MYVCKYICMYRYVCMHITLMYVVIRILSVKVEINK